MPKALNLIQSTLKNSSSKAKRKKVSLLFLKIDEMSFFPPPRFSATALSALLPRRPSTTRQCAS
jgi:hypothetical protein